LRIKASLLCSEGLNPSGPTPVKLSMQTFLYYNCYKNSYKKHHKVRYMNVNVQFKGIMEDILEEAERRGIAKTKTEALRLGVLELNNRYHLLERRVEELEDLQDVKELEEMRSAVRKGKARLISEKKMLAMLK